MLRLKHIVGTILEREEMSISELTNKNLDFLSDKKLISVLQSVLTELDTVATFGAHRSTTYLAVSAIEGLFRALLYLLKTEPSIRSVWIIENENPKEISKLTLSEMEKILANGGALPEHFEENYKTVINYRNYIHSAKELEDLKPINQSVGQLALACLNAVIEKYEFQRFVGGQKWKLEYGLALVPSANVIHMPQKPAQFSSLLVSEQSSQQFREINFHVVIPPGTIFNFIYNYQSLDNFMGARIDGREIISGRGYDSGRIVCKKWGAWVRTDKFTEKSEPNTQQRDHTVRIIFSQTNELTLIVDEKQLELESGISWGFKPKQRIGFMSEQGQVSIMDIKITSK